MADTKGAAAGNVDVWFVPSTGIANINAPTAAEIAAGVRLTEAIAWEGTTFPANDASNDTDDSSLDDSGNVKARGAAQYKAELAFFRPVAGDTTSAYARAWATFKTSRVLGYLITRVFQRTTGEYTAPTAGDWISVYKVVSSRVADKTDGESSVKYVVGFMSQGSLAVNTQVKGSSAVTVTNATGSTSTTVGGHVVLRATLNSKRATNVVTWSTTDDSVASVSQNGVVTGVSAGTASIVASHPSASASSTAVTITVS